jgi:hypothetical protein
MPSTPTRDEFENGEAFIATVARLFASEGDLGAVDLLSNARSRFKWYSHDNWEGGFDIYTLYLDTPIGLYSRIQDRKAELEEAILKRLQAVTQAHTDDHVQGVTIVAEVVAGSNWRDKAQLWVRGTGDGAVETAGSVSAEGGAIICRPEVFKRPTRPRGDSEVAVMMPFSAEFRSTYDAIRSTCDVLGLKARRSDDIWVNTTFIQDIFELIYCARVVVVDFSTRNPNVMYEAGIAHTLGRDVIPITRSMTDVPSDVGHHRALVYLPNAEGLDTLKQALRLRLETVTGREPKSP